MWNVAGPEPEVLTKHTLPAAVASLEWHPTANELAGTLLDNNLLAWQGVVPGHLMEPHVAVPDAFSLPGVPRLCVLPVPPATSMRMPSRSAGLKACCASSATPNSSRMRRLLFRLQFPAA